MPASRPRAPDYRRQRRREYRRADVSTRKRAARSAGFRERLDHVGDANAEAAPELTVLANSGARAEAPARRANVAARKLPQE
jgi:hypothetical protein